MPPGPSWTPSGSGRSHPKTLAPIALVVSELLTNALRHGGGTCTLRLTAHPDTIEVAVGDASPRAPRIRTTLYGGTGGFG